MHLDVATGGELHVALAAGVPADRLVLHGNNKSIDELRDGARRRRRPHRGRQLRRARPARPRCTPTTGCGPKVLRAGHARRRGPHPRVRPHRPGRLEVRLRRGRRRRGRGGRPGRRTRRPSTSSASTCTSAARSSSPTSSTRPSRWSPRGSASSACPSCRSAAGSASPTSRARRRRRSPSGARPSSSGCRDAGITARVTAEPGRSIVAQAAVTLYTVGTIKDVPGVRTYVSVDGGMSDNPRPVLYGSGYEAFLPRAADAERPGAVTVVGKHCESGDVLVRDAAGPRRPRGRRRAGHARSPAPTATRWAPTTTRCSARRWCSCATATPAWSSAARPTTTSSATTSCEPVGSGVGAHPYDVAR